MEIKKDPKFETFLVNIEASNSTQLAYINMMSQFCNLVKKTPTQLIDEGIKEIKSGKLACERKIIEDVAKFKTYMKGKGLSPKSQALGMSVLKSFYKHHDMPLSESIGKVRRAKTLQENKGFIKKEDVKALITNAKSLRERAIFFMMATSGMAIQEIVNLQIEHITFDDITTIRIRRQKSDVDYVTFISPEATKALKDYFDERNRSDQYRIKSPEDFVFVSTGTRKKVAGQLSVGTMSKLFNILGKQLGYKKGTGYIKTRSHALRKFFASTLENAGFPKYKVDYMMGHTISDQDEAYFEQNISKLKELYKLYLPHLTFEHEIKIQSLNTEDAKRLSELEQTNATLLAKIIKFEQALAEMRRGNELEFELWKSKK